VSPHYVEDVRPLKTTARCHLTPRGIVIDVRVAGFRPKLLAIEIAFSEVDELRRLSYIEAASDPHLGPNTNDLRDVLRGRIARPTVLHEVHSLGTTLLVRGRNLFYLITVDRDGVDEVMSAYAAFTARAPYPQHGAAVPPSPSRRSDASAR